MAQHPSDIIEMAFMATTMAQCAKIIQMVNGTSLSLMSGWKEGRMNEVVTQQNLFHAF